MHCGRCEWRCGCNSSTLREFVANDLHIGMRSRCDQLCGLMCGRQSGGTLTLPTWTFKCEERLYTTKHGKHKTRSNISSHLYIGLWSVTVRKIAICGKVGQRCRRLGIKSSEIVHSGVSGHIKNMSMRGAKYFLTFIHDFLRKIWVYMIKFKGD